MSEEEINELQEYNLEYMEAMMNEDEFGGDYTSGVDLKYANKQIKQLQQESKKLKDQIDKSINYIDQVIMYHISNFDYKTVYDDLDKLIGILSGSEDSKNE